MLLCKIQKLPRSKQQGRDKEVYSTVDMRECKEKVVIKVSNIQSSSNARYVVADSCYQQVKLGN